MPNFMKKKQIELNAVLWKIFSQIDSNFKLPLPENGRVSFICNTPIPENYWKHIGYLCINKFVFRIDIFEKIFFLARQKVKCGPFLESSELMNPIGCNSNQLKDILMYCGYQNINLSDNKKLYFYSIRKETNKKKKQIKKI